MQFFPPTFCTSIQFTMDLDTEKQKQVTMIFLMYNFIVHK